MAEIDFADNAGSSIGNEIFRCRACVTCSEAYKKVSKKINVVQNEKQTWGGYGARANEKAHDEALCNDFMKNETRKKFSRGFESSS